MVKISEQTSRTFAEYVVIPRYQERAHVVENVNLTAPLTKYIPGKEEPRLTIPHPLLGARMLSVTGKRLMVTTSDLGGSAVLPASMPAETQAEHIREVKKHRPGLIRPVTIHPDTAISSAKQIMKDLGYSRLFITKDGNLDSKLLGMVSESYISDWTIDPTQNVEEVMNSNLLTEYTSKINSYDDASKIIKRTHVGALPIIDKSGKLKFAAFRRDRRRLEGMTNRALGKDGKPLALVAINTRDYEDRVPILVDAGANMLFIDAAEGHKEFQKDTIEWTRKYYGPDLPLGGGNVVTDEGAKALINWGVDAILALEGSGHMCTTTDQKAIGRAPAIAVYEVAKQRDKHFAETGVYIPVFADGGMKFPKEMINALALGADALMLGTWFSRFDESNAPVHPLDKNYKVHWGEASELARSTQEGRYGHQAFPEGEVVLVERAGRLNGKEWWQTLAKMKAAYASSGSLNTEEFHHNAHLEIISPATEAQGGVYGVRTAAGQDLEAIMASDSVLRVARGAQLY